MLTVCARSSPGHGMWPHRRFARAPWGQAVHDCLLALLLREDNEEQRESQVSDGCSRGASTRTPTSPPGDQPQPRHSPAAKPEVIVTHSRRRWRDKNACPVLRAPCRTNAHAPSCLCADTTTPFADGPAATSNSFVTRCEGGRGPVPDLGEGGGEDTRASEQVSGHK